MHKLHSLLFSLLLLLLAACSATPRVSNQDERDAAIIAMNTARSAVAVFHTRGKLTDAQRDLALSQLDRFRERIDESATVPISWVTWYSDLSTFAVEWALPPPPPQPD